jgi:hypothetical protein
MNDKEQPYVHISELDLSLEIAEKIMKCLKEHEPEIWLKLSEELKKAAK